MNVNELAKDKLNDAALDDVSGGFGLPAVAERFGAESWYCICSHLNHDYAERCFRCGKKVTDLRKCPKCGCYLDILYAREICPNCGASV